MVPPRSAPRRIKRLVEEARGGGSRGVGDAIFQSVLKSEVQGDVGQRFPGFPLWGKIPHWSREERS